MGCRIQEEIPEREPRVFRKQHETVATTAFYQLRAA